MCDFTEFFYILQWPLNLVIKNETVYLIEKATTLLLEIELVKWKLGELYKDLLTSKKGMYFIKL